MRGSLVYLKLHTIIWYDRCLIREHEIAPTILCVVSLRPRVPCEHARVRVVRQWPVRGVPSVQGQLYRSVLTPELAPTTVGER